jgi:translocation and assembly module TamB
MLRQLEADVEGGRWTLLRPATFTLGDSARIAVRDLELTEAASGGRLFAEGVIWPIGQADARVEIAEFPVGDVQTLLGVTPQFTGDVDAVAQVRAGGGVPAIDVTFRVDSGAVRGLVMDELEGAVRFADGIIDARAVARLDTAGALTLALRLPAELRVDSPSFRLLPEGAVTGTLETADLALAPLLALDPRLRDVQGRVTGRVDLAGTVQTPEVDGRIALTNGAVTVVPLEKRFTDIRADLALEGRRIIVREVTATAEGTATARGEIVLEELTDPTAAIAVQLSAFRPMGVADREDAAFTGTLTLLGPLRAPSLTGRIAINDGYIPIPDFGGPIDDFTDLPAMDGAETQSWLDALRVENLRVEIANDVWFIGEGAQAQLGGELAVELVDDRLTLVGTLEGQRGTYTLQAGPIIRRFEIANAQVRFLGLPEINPAIDITARRTVLDQQGRQFDIDVRITGTMRTPRLSLASADLATLPESELLSFLFFGQGSANLNAQGNAGGVLLEETVYSGLAEFAGLQLERALVHDLGLSFDVFQLRFGGPGGIGGFGTPTVVVGWELGSEFFLTVEGAITALSGGAANTRENLWAIRLEWAFDPDSRARIGYEPVARNRYLRGFSLGLSPLQPENQFVFELRRRWTY